MSGIFRNGTAALFAALLIVGIMSGCDESVNPIIGSEYPFTIWGFMNSGADTQYVRVFSISDELSLDSSTSIDAEVFSTDVTTGERREWTYKTVHFDSARTGHIFWSPFRAEYEHRYELEVVRSDGARSSADVVVPPKVDFEIDVSNIGVTIPVHIEGDVPNLVGPKVTYHAINVPPAAAWPHGTPVHPPVLHSVTIPYDEELESIANGWRLTINMTADTNAVREEYRASCLITPPQYSAPNVWLRSMEFSVVAADSAWHPPGGVFDPDILAVPGTLSNVRNGYGFFGAGEGIRREWIPSPESRRVAGYRFDARCRMGPFDADECRNPPIPCIGENIEDLWTLWLR